MMAVFTAISLLGSIMVFIGYQTIFSPVNQHPSLAQARNLDDFSSGQNLHTSYEVNQRSIFSTKTPFSQRELNLKTSVKSELSGNTLQDHPGVLNDTLQKNIFKVAIASLLSGQLNLTNGIEPLNKSSSYDDTLHDEDSDGATLIEDDHPSSTLPVPEDHHAIEADNLNLLERSKSLVESNYKIPHRIDNYLENAIYILYSLKTCMENENETTTKPSQSELEKHRKQTNILFSLKTYAENENESNNESLPDQLEKHRKQTYGDSLNILARSLPVNNSHESVAPNQSDKTTVTNASESSMDSKKTREYLSQPSWATYSTIGVTVVIIVLTLLLSVLFIVCFCKKRRRRRRRI